MPVVKTITEVWGGEEPLQTKHGPMHYIICRFAEDPDKTASVGCKPQNVERVKQALTSLIECEAEFELQLNPKGNYKITDYAGKHGSELQVLTEPDIIGRGAGDVHRASSSRSDSPPPPTTVDESKVDYLVSLLEEVDDKLAKLSTMVEALLVGHRVGVSPVKKGTGEGPEDSPSPDPALEAIIEEFNAEVEE